MDTWRRLGTGAFGVAVVVTVAEEGLIVELAAVFEGEFCADESVVVLVELLAAVGGFESRLLVDMSISDVCSLFIIISVGVSD